MRKIFFIITTLMFFTSSTALSSQWFGNGTVVYISLVILLSLLAFFKRVEVKYNPILVLVISAFTLLCSGAAVINSDAALLYSTIGYIVLFLSTMIVIPSYFKDSSGKVVILTIIVSQIPIILLPIITNGIDSHPYRGIFDNPNSFGGVSATVFVVVLAVFLQRLEAFLYTKEKRPRLTVASLFVLLSLLFLLVIMSGSRTSFVTCIIAMIVSGLFLLLFTVKHRLIGNLIVKATFVFPLGGLVFWVTNKFIPIVAFADEVIIRKFANKSGDMLDGRSWVWEKTAGEAGLFGNGNDYFSLHVGLGAHNTFVSILGQYGWLAVSAFAIIILIGLYYCSIYALSDNNHKYLPLLMLITFFALSMGEVMLYKLSMIASFILIGVVANNKKVIIR